jgi:hypothetical protein
MTKGPAAQPRTVRYRSPEMTFEETTRPGSCAVRVQKRDRFFTQLDRRMDRNARAEISTAAGMPSGVFPAWQAWLVTKRHERSLDVWRRRPWKQRTRRRGSQIAPPDVAVPIGSDLAPELFARATIPIGLIESGGMLPLRYACTDGMTLRPVCWVHHNSRKSACCPFMLAGFNQRTTELAGASPPPV